MKPYTPRRDHTISNHPLTPELRKVIEQGRAWGLQIRPYNELLTARGSPEFNGPYSHGIWSDGHIGHHIAEDYPPDLNEVAPKVRATPDLVDGLLAMALIHEIAHAIDPNNPHYSDEDHLIAFELRLAKRLEIPRKFVRRWFSTFISSSFAGSWQDYEPFMKRRLVAQSSRRYRGLGIFDEKNQIAITTLPTCSWISQLATAEAS